MTPALRLMEKRREPRHAAHGLVILRLTGPPPVAICGELVDVSKHGFRASYRGAPFEAGQVIEFEHQGRSGGARVVWNRVDGQRVQTGFLVL